MPRPKIPAKFTAEVFDPFAASAPACARCERPMAMEEHHALRAAVYRCPGCGDRATVPIGAVQSMPTFPNVPLA